MPQQRTTDDAFVRQYAPIARLERQKLIALAISVVFFIVLLTGTASALRLSAPFL